jgi:hypothetical protein
MFGDACRQLTSHGVLLSSASGLVPPVVLQAGMAKMSEEFKKAGAEIYH